MTNYKVDYLYLNQKTEFFKQVFTSIKSLWQK